MLGTFDGVLLGTEIGKSALMRIGLKIVRPIVEASVKTLFRVTVTFVSAVATFYFVYWVGGALVFSALPGWIALVGAGLVAIVAARYVWVRTASAASSLVSSVLVGALVTGAVAFSAGFFGPIVFAPSANQGPLLGIFITGPLVFLLGGGGRCSLLVRATPLAKQSMTVPPNRSLNRTSRRRRLRAVRSRPISLVRWADRAWITIAPNSRLTEARTLRC